ncbi:hypothetical protein BKN37_06655 [Mycobacterium talmoniae]|nr:hypothetical protein BKN37_06655 [Mycobacterium talmoniae]
MNDLQVLQAARLKGRATDADLTAAAGISDSDVATLLQSLIDAGELDRAGSRLKLTAVGRARLETLLASERAELDPEVLQEHYQEFDVINAEFKQLVTDWQLIDGVRPNDHSDADYDADIVKRLVDLHERFAPLLGRLVQLVPRLSPYPARFGSALEKLAAGERKWFALPLIDSYHTVWFELHEELIGVAGLTRADEAAAGRAE